MGIIYTTKCDLCGRVESSPAPSSMTSVRFVLNTETKHACADCFRMLQMAFKTGVAALLDPVAAVVKAKDENGALKKENGQLKTDLNAERFSNERRQRWLEEYERTLRTMRAERDGLFQQFIFLERFLQTTQLEWKDLGFFRAVAAFRSRRAEFVCWAESINKAMGAIRDAWPSMDSPR